MILITGANGFVGSAFLKHFFSRGYKVCGLVRRGSDLRRLRDEDFNLRYGDLRNSDSLHEAMKGCNTVIHCAARSLDWGCRREFEDINVKGVQNIVETASKTGTVSKIIYISTANVAGFGLRYMGEQINNHYKPPFIYSRTKLEGERVATRLCENLRIDLIILRPSAIYGPGDWKFSFEMIDRIANSFWPMVGRGKAVFTPVFIENLCKAAELAVQSNKTFGVYNITDDVTVSWMDFSLKVASALGVPLNYRSFPAFFALGAALLYEAFHLVFKPEKEPEITLYRVIRSWKDFHYSCKLAIDELGYDPDPDIDKHIKKTVEWYREAVKEGKK